MSTIKLHILQKKILLLKERKMIFEREKNYVTLNLSAGRG